MALAAMGIVTDPTTKVIADSAHTPRPGKTARRANTVPFPVQTGGTADNTIQKAGKMVSRRHTGEDWVCDSERTLVAPASGTILRNEADKNYGYFIVMGVADGKAILVAHMAVRSGKAKGTRVNAGDIVGTMGSTGNSSGAHLHIEVENAGTWAYNKNLLKLSAYINFNSFTNGGDFEMAKTWTNGSTSENVYAETTLKTKIGSLNPRESCDCLAIVNGRYLVKYQVDKTGTYKTGFVSYAGGVK